MKTDNEVHWLYWRKKKLGQPQLACGKMVRSHSFSVDQQSVTCKDCLKKRRTKRAASTYAAARSK